MGSINQQRRQVLVVDDDIDIRESLASMLSDEGFDVRVAENGLEALIVLKGDSKPDVMLLDLTMPVIDGHQVLKAMRDMGLIDEIPVIVISAVSFRNAQGSVANMSKPLSFGRLIELVNHHAA